MTSPDAVEDRAERGPITYAAHTRLTASGSLGLLNGGVESWAINLSFDKVIATTQAQVDAAFGHMASYVSSPTSYIHSSCHLRQVKVSLLDTAGHLVGNPVTHLGDVPGGSNLQVNPPQTALVISLGTGVRGRQNRGRVFMPQPANAPSVNDFEIPADQRDLIEQNFLVLATALQQDLGSRLVIASTKGHNTPVTLVRVGRVLDTMRSRRRKLTESYDPGGTVVA